MTSPHAQATGPLIAPPPTALAAAGEASDLDRLLQMERVKAEARALALEPNDFQAARDFAKMIATSGMFPDGQGKAPSEGSILLRIMTGRTLGIPSTIALQHVYDVYGRTGISAALKRALVRRHPEAERYEMVESDNVHCLWICKRKRNIEHRFPWTIDDAKTAGLIKKDGNWEKHPRRMLQARASGEAADVDFSDACMGLPSIDEIVESAAALDFGIGGGAAYSIPAAAGGGRPPRDWRKETDEIKAKVIAMVGQGQGRDARELFTLFEAEAPTEFANEVKEAYNEALAAKKGEKAPPKTAPPATGQQTLGAAEAYLPPEKRGDAYAGPDKPPPGWKP